MGKESENQVLSVPCGSICKYNQNLQSLAPVQRDTVFWSSWYSKQVLFKSIGYMPLHCLTKESTQIFLQIHMSNNADENQKFGEKVNFKQFFYICYLISIYFFIHCLFKPPLIGSTYTYVKKCKSDLGYPILDTTLITVC